MLGGYTTFSSYALEIVTLLRDDKLWRAMAYVLVSNVAGITLPGGFLWETCDLARAGFYEICEIGGSFRSSSAANN